MDQGVLHQFQPSGRSLVLDDKRHASLSQQGHDVPQIREPDALHVLIHLRACKQFRLDEEDVLQLRHAVQRPRLFQLEEQYHKKIEQNLADLVLQGEPPIVVKKSLLPSHLKSSTHRR